MHSTCFTSCNRCKNLLEPRPCNRLKHCSPVPATSPLVPQAAEVWTRRVGLCVIHYPICMHVHRLQSIAQISTRSNFRRLCDFTRKCRTWRKTLLRRRLINREQAQRRTLSYDRLTRPVFRRSLGTSLVTVVPTVITLNRFKVCIIS